MRVRNVTLGGLKGYSAEKWISRKNTPPSYTDPGGPRMVETHSYRLSPLGPALQLGGGSSVISASSFCILLALVLSALDIFGWGGRASDAAEDPPELDCRGPLEELRAAGAGPVETTGGGVGVWGPVETGGAGGGTGTESDPRAPVDEADINQYLVFHG